MPIDKTMTQTEIQKQPKLHTPKQQQQHHDATHQATGYSIIRKQRQQEPNRTNKP